MLKYFLLALLIFPQINFSQKIEIHNTLEISNDVKSKEIANYFKYYIDSLKRIKPNEVEKIKSWKNFNNEVFINKTDYRNFNYNLWLQSISKILVTIL